MADKNTPANGTPGDPAAAFDWAADDAIPEPTVLATKDRPIIDVPSALVAIAQKSLNSGERLSFSFRGNEKKASAFAALMKAAGDHTTPQSTLTVVQEGIVVKVRAGQRRGRKAKDGATPETPASE